jgi:hypothetical protein
MAPRKRRGEGAAGVMDARFAQELPIYRHAIHSAGRWRWCVLP